MGLHPDANLEVVEDAFARRKKWEKERCEFPDLKMLQQQKPAEPTLEPQVYYISVFFIHISEREIFFVRENKKKVQLGKIRYPPKQSK